MFESEWKVTECPPSMTNTDFQTAVHWLKLGWTVRRVSHPDVYSYIEFSGKSRVFNVCISDEYLIAMPFTYDDYEATDWYVIKS